MSQALGRLRTRARSGLQASSFGASRIITRGGRAFQASSLDHPDLRLWQPIAGSPDSDLNPEQGRIAARARDLTRNHGVAAGALQTTLDNVLGCGLWLSPTPSYTLLGRDLAWAQGWAQKVKALWRDWSETRWCDAAESCTLDGLATQFFSGAWMNGDGLALPLWLPSPYTRYATRLQVIESDRLSNPDFGPDTARLRGGIEIDRYGAPLAFHVRRAHPGDDAFMLQDPSAYTWERIPARTAWGRARVIHGGDRRYRAGQSKGIPALASVMRQFKVLSDYEHAELKSAVVNAMVGLVVESSLSQDALVELLSTNGDALQSYMQGLSGRSRSAIDFGGGGMILPVPLGDKVSGFTPARPSTAYAPFTDAAFMKVGVALGMPRELLLKDFSKTNYSSARAALLEAWRFFMGRREWLSFSFYQPAYELFLEEMVDAGEVPDLTTDELLERRSAWCRARWIGPGRGWIDPYKEAQAAELRMDNLLSTLEDECAEQGKDVEEVLERAAFERGLLERHGLTRGSVKRPASGPTADVADLNDNPAAEAAA